MASERLVSSAISPPVLGVPSAMSNLIERGIGEVLIWCILTKLRSTKLCVAPESIIREVVIHPCRGFTRTETMTWRCGDVG
jgi:hypothetical protein